MPFYAFAALALEFSGLSNDDINMLAHYCNEGKNGMVRVQTLQALINSYS